jgi:hypothetical protein
MMPSSSSCLKSALTAANFRLSSFRNLEAMGSPCDNMVDNIIADRQ